MAEKKVSEEQSIPVDEIKTPVFISVRRFTRSLLIVLLSFVCVLAGILIYQVHTPVDSFRPVLTEKKANPFFLSQARRKTVIVPVKKQEIKNNKTKTLVSSPLQDSEPKVSLPQPKSELESKTEEKKTEEKTLAPLLTLHEVLEIRDHLTEGASCSLDLKNILQKRMPEGHQNLTSDLMPICAIDHSIFKDMQTLFIKNKKRALFTYYCMKNPKWLAYVKSIIANIVDVRKLKSIKENPKGILSMAQNFLLNKDIERTVAILHKLPPEMQADYQEFFGIAQTYLTAKSAVNKLILSFEKGE